VNSQRKLKLASLSRPGPAKAMLGQASFLAWAGAVQLRQGQAGLGQVRPAQAGLGWPKQDIFLHGLNVEMSISVFTNSPSYTVHFRQRYDFWVQTTYNKTFKTISAQRSSSMRKT